MKKALISGISGQDGSYLAELLLAKGYEVHGIVRRQTAEDALHGLVNLANILDRVTLHVGSVDNHLSVYKIINLVKPDECYHLAASSFVSYDYEDEMSVLANNFNSTHFFLASIKELVPHCKFYFAGSSEMFGNADSMPQNEDSKFNPRTIYGISKVSSYYLVLNYRINHNIFACTGILYNHESPRRGSQFVTRKISLGVARIYLGMAKKLKLGNLNVMRDWGYAPEYTDAMWRIMQHDKPDTFVIATGKLHSIKYLMDVAFSVVDLKYDDYLEVSSIYYRPDDMIPLVGDISKAQSVLQWKPKKKFEEIIGEMVHNDIGYLKGKG